MSLTTLDPVTALVVIDLQKGIAAYPLPELPGVIAHAGELARAFRRHQLPVVLVNVAGAPSGRTERGRPSLEATRAALEIVPELAQQPSDHVVTKRTRGAFTNTDLEAYLRAHDVTQVVIVGVATSSGVESTARHAHELGFHVTLATDAMTDRAAATHEHSVTQIFPGIGETGTTKAILELLDKTRAAARS